jgi:DNA-binding MarR family transcriptional regulator
MNTDRRLPAADILAERRDIWPEAVPPVAQMMVRIFRLSDLVIQQSTRQVAIHGLSFLEFEVLATLRGSPSPHVLTPTELYAAVLISSGGMTKVLHALEQGGLVSRDVGEGDRRSKPVRLTTQGRVLAERAMADVLRIDEELVSGALSQTEIDHMTRMVAKLLARLEPEGKPMTIKKARK